MSDEGEMLARQKAELEIEKLRAEIDQLKLPTSFIERNWQALVTAFAAILAACGGLAALVNAASQTVDLWTHLGQQKELVALQQSETAAQQATVEADKRDIAAQKSELAESQKVQQETQQLQAEQLQLDNLESFIHYQRANVFPNLINKLQQDGYGHYPICVAKTQYSFSTDPQLKGAPSDHTINVREVRLAAGAEFIVMVCGDVMTMPGLPKVPSAERIDLDDNGRVVGLF